MKTNFEQIDNNTYVLDGEFGIKINANNLKNIAKQVRKNSIKNNQSITIGSDNNAICTRAQSIIYNYLTDCDVYSASDITLDEIKYIAVHKNSICIYLQYKDNNMRIYIVDCNNSKYYIKNENFDNIVSISACEKLNRNYYILGLYNRLQLKKVDLHKINVSVFTDIDHSFYKNLFKKLKVNADIYPVCEFHKTKSNVNFVIDDNELKVYNDKMKLVDNGDLACLFMDYYSATNDADGVIIKSIKVNDKIKTLTSDVIECNDEELCEYSNNYNYLMVISNKNIIFKDYKYVDNVSTILHLLKVLAYYKKPLSKLLNYTCNQQCITKTIAINNVNNIKRAMNERFPKFVFKVDRANIGSANKYYFDNNSSLLLEILDNNAKITALFATEIECERVIKSMEEFIAKYDTLN